MAYEAPSKKVSACIAKEDLQLSSLGVGARHRSCTHSKPFKLVMSPPNFSIQLSRRKDT